MATIVQVTLKTADALPANYLTNQFCIDGYDVGDGSLPAMVTAFEDFYSSLVSPLFSSWMVQNGHIIKFYTAGGPQPNYPYHETTFNLASAPSGTGLPTEVAVCLSFQALRIPGTPQARRRGRIYLGPLKATVNSNQRPLASAASAIVASALVLHTDISAAFAGANWAVWSGLDGTAAVLDNCWVDDAFDTQRSRGQAPSSRTVGTF